MISVKIVIYKIVKFNLWMTNKKIFLLKISNIWALLIFSVRVGNYESDRPIMIYESSHPGEILTAVCPNNKTIITAGTSSVSIKFYIGLNLIY